MSTHLPLVLLAALLTIFVCTGSVAPAKANDAASEDLSAQSTEQLMQLQEDLKAKIAAADATVARHKATTAELRKKQADLTAEADNLLGAAEWEKSEYTARESELATAKADVLAKQAAMADMLAKVEALKGQIGSLQSTLGVLEKERSATEARYAAPSLADVLDHKAAQWGSVSRGVYNKTMTSIVPALEAGAAQEPADGRDARIVVELERAGPLRAGARIAVVWGQGCVGHVNAPPSVGSRCAFGRPL